MIIFIDFETTGLIPQVILPNGKRYNEDYTNLGAYDNARAVQMAFVVYHNDGSLYKNPYHNYIIKPEGFQIPIESTKIHKISHKYAMENGININEALNNLEKILPKIQLIVMHNVNFDKNILLSEAFRQNRFNLVNRLNNQKYFCTMRGRGIKEYVGLPSDYYDGYKLPKLSELHNRLFQDKVSLDILHDGLMDAKITAKCFLALRTLKIIK